MAKAPRAGSCKTRLEPLLGSVGCAALQAALIEVAAGWAAAVAPQGAFVSFGPDGADEDELRPHVPDPVRLFADAAGDLGDRLAAATARVLGERPGPLLVVGTDQPLLAPGDADAAYAALDGGADAVFGPALDGGYWLVGLARPLPELFALGTAWGGREVLERSLALAACGGLRIELLEVRRDLDDAGDARALLGTAELPVAVAGALRARAA